MSRRTFIVLVCSIVLQTIVFQLNHYLAPWHVNLFVGGLLVTFPSLRIGYREGFWSVFLTGLYLDAASPVPFGLHALLFALAYAVIASRATASRVRRR